MIDSNSLKNLIDQAKQLARQCREITGKPLGITGEVGEFTAAHLLNLQLTDARQPGYDAIAPDGRRIQIKTRCILPSNRSSGRLGRINLDHEWDTVMLVLISNDFELISIHEAQRANIERELTKPGSKARNEKGALSISKFRSIASTIWDERGPTLK